MTSSFLRQSHWLQRRLSEPPKAMRKGIQGK